MKQHVIILILLFSAIALANCTQDSSPPIAMAAPPSAKGSPNSPPFPQPRWSLKELKALGEDPSLFQQKRPALSLVWEIPPSLQEGEEELHRVRVQNCEEYLNATAKGYYALVRMQERIEQEKYAPCLLPFLAKQAQAYSVDPWSDILENFRRFPVSFHPTEEILWIDSELERKGLLQITGDDQGWSLTERYSSSEKPARARLIRRIEPLALADFDQDQRADLLARITEQQGEQVRKTWVIFFVKVGEIRAKTAKKLRVPRNPHLWD